MNVREYLERRSPNYYLEVLLGLNEIRYLLNTFRGNLSICLPEIFFLKLNT